MSMLGFLAGVGDAAREHNARQDDDNRKKRDVFADDLRRVMESEDWPEQARMAAAQMRYKLYSDPKIKGKDYEKMWQEVHAASQRPGVPNREAAAAASETPGLQSLNNTLSKGPQSEVPAAAPGALTMGTPQPGSALDLLRPDGAAPSFGDTGALGLQAPQQTNNVLAPPTLMERTQQKIAENQTTMANNPTPTIAGPYSRAEKNSWAWDQFKQQQEAQLDQFRQQEQIRADMRPDKFVIGADGAIVLNQQTGEVEKTGITKPEKLSNEEQVVQDMLTANNLPNTAANRVAMRERMIQQDAEAHRDPGAGDLRAVTAYNMNENRRAQFDQQTVIRAEALKRDYNSAKFNASLSIRYAQALKACVQQASLGGDLGVIFSAMRMLDPGSVVREQEYRTGQDLGGPWHSFLGRMNQLRGNGILDETTRQEFNRLADLFVKNASRDYMLINNTYMSMADARGIPAPMVGFSGPSTYRPGSTPSYVRPFAPMGTEPRTPAGPSPSSTLQAPNTPVGQALNAIINELKK